jgi:hypothetical protein
MLTTDIAAMALKDGAFNLPMRRAREGFKNSFGIRRVRDRVIAVGLSMCCSYRYLQSRLLVESDNDQGYLS